MATTYLTIQFFELSVQIEHRKSHAQEGKNDDKSSMLVFKIQVKFFAYPNKNINGNAHLRGEANEVQPSVRRLFLW